MTAAALALARHAPAAAGRRYARLLRSLRGGRPLLHAPSLTHDTPPSRKSSACEVSQSTVLRGTVDTDGRLLMVNLTTADVSDSAGAQMILEAIRRRWPWLKHLFADGAYDRTTLLDKAAFLDFVIEVVRRC